MTEAGHKKLKQELTYLKTVKRAEVIERIKWARTFCDFAEDSEYSEAIKEQDTTEERIKQLEQMLKNVEIIDQDHEQSHTITLGHTVTFVELPNGEEASYTIVGKVEADPVAGKISNEAPMAKSLLGQKLHDEIDIQVPDGQITIKIIKIE